MIAYNKTWLYNLWVRHESEKLFDATCLTAEELVAIKESHPVGFYMPGIVVRIGLFMLTCVTVLFSFGLLSMLFESTHVLNSFAWPLFLGLITVAALEIMLKNRPWYRAGMDDSLMWLGAILITGALCWMLEPGGYGNGHADTILLSFVFFALSITFVLRYADMLMAAIATLSLYAFIFFFWTRLGFMGTATVPFIMMIVAGFGYSQLLQLSKKLKVRNYDNCIVVAQVVSLVVLYAAGNYFITDWANHQLNNIPQNVKLDVKWAPFFWLWTMLVPLTYIGLGLKNKSVVILRVGLALVAAAVFTFRTYYHIISVELALIIGGSLLLALVYFVVRYLKKPKYGFTYADIDNGNTANNSNIEGLIAVATFKHESTPEGAPNKFGGGDFGGGGSSGKF
jgi:hypothetical protein